MKTALCTLLPLLCLSALAQPTPKSSSQAAPGVKIWKCGDTFALIPTAGDPSCTPAGELWRCGGTYTNSPPPGDKSCVKVAMQSPKKMQKQEYLNCQLAASKAPTELGVRVALELCNQRFGE